MARVTTSEEGLGGGGLGSREYSHLTLSALIFLCETRIFE